MRRRVHAEICTSGQMGYSGGSQVPTACSLINFAWNLCKLVFWFRKRVGMFWVGIGLGCFGWDPVKCWKGKDFWEVGSGHVLKSKGFLRSRIRPASMY
jgi:hypothetical protein